MSDLTLSPDETAALIEYARRKYAEERWPLSPELRSVRAAIQKLRSEAAIPPMQIKPHVPSLHAQRQNRRR